MSGSVGERASVRDQNLGLSDCVFRKVFNGENLVKFSS